MYEHILEWESGIEYIKHTHQIQDITMLYWIEYNFYIPACTHTYTHEQHNMHIVQVCNTKENGYHFYDRMFGRNLLTADSAMQGIVYPSILLYMSHILMLSD